MTMVSVSKSVNSAQSPVFSSHIFCSNISDCILLNFNPESYTPWNWVSRWVLKMSNFWQRSVSGFGAPLLFREDREPKEIVEQGAHSLAASIGEIPYQWMFPAMMRMVKQGS